MFRATKSLFNFATLALVEHNGKVLSKNTLKLITAAHKLKDEVAYLLVRLTYLSVVKLLQNYCQISINLQAMVLPK